MNGLHTWEFGLATALTFSILYTVCALVVAVFPEGTVDFFNNWFHGLDLRLLKPLAGRPLTLIQLVSGLASVAAISFATGAVLAGSYNLFLHRAARR